MYKIIILLLLLLLLFSMIFNNLEMFKNIKKPCDNNLSDYEYLLHMIPHHQVAVDISIMLKKKTTNPIMQNILRVLIWTQKYEIDLMKEMLKSLPNKITSNIKMNNKYITTISSLTKPNYLDISNTYCDPHFFNPKEHMKHLQHINLTDEEYIKHMIPHHQVAVDMSKKLLKNTTNDFMIYLLYRIIRSQENEIILLSDLQNKNNIKYKSKLVK